MKSRRFQPSAWTKWLVPCLLILLLAGLLAIFVLVGLSVFGFNFGY